jgi:hypothetical protein
VIRVQPYSPSICQEATMSTAGMILVVRSTFLGKRECWDLGTLESGPHVFMSL